MIDTPSILNTEAQPTAAIRLCIPPAEMINKMGPGYIELTTTVAAQGILPSGPWFCYHHSLTDTQYDFEISLPVSQPVTPVGRVVNSLVPASKVARTLYHGPYEGLPNAWTEFMGWIESQGLVAEETLWETYLTDPSAEPDPSKWITELTWPLVG